VNRPAPVHSRDSAGAQRTARANCFSGNRCFARARCIPRDRRRVDGRRFAVGRSLNGMRWENWRRLRTSMGCRLRLERRRLRGFDCGAIRRSGARRTGLDDTMLGQRVHCAPGPICHYGPDKNPQGNTQAGVDHRLQVRPLGPDTGKLPVSQGDLVADTSSERFRHLGCALPWLSRIPLFRMVFIELPLRGIDNPPNVVLSPPWNPRGTRVEERLRLAHGVQSAPAKHGRSISTAPAS